jgi:iron complex transport system substrate-binding protein
VTTRSPRLAAALVALAALTATACGGGGDTAAAPATTAPEAHGGGSDFPVTVEVCGEPTTYDAPPERAVVNDNNMVEMLFALGVSDRMVAYAGAGERMRLDEFADDYAALEFLGEDYISLEPLLGTDPDFVFSGWNYGFSESTGLTPDALADLGIESYVLTESCRRVRDDLGPSSIDELYTDMRNLGAIFGVPERAEALIEGWEARLDEVESRLPPEDERDARVMAFLSGDDTAGTAPGLTIVSELYQRAGAVNVFDDLDEMWGRVSWEEVAERDPELIVVTDYGGSAAGQRGVEKIEQLRDLPVLADVAAVRDDRFLAFPQTAVNPGIRFVEGIETLAATLHPDRFADVVDDPGFGLPDDGTGEEGTS